MGRNERFSVKERRPSPAYRRIGAVLKSLSKVWNLTRKKKPDLAVQSGYCKFNSPATVVVVDNQGAATARPPINKANLIIRF